MSRSLRICVAGLLVLATAVAGRAAGWNVPGSHPRLLIGRGEVAALRIRCGIDGYRDDPVAKARGITFGSQREVLDRLKQVWPEIASAHARPDDLYVPAVLHLVTGELGRPDQYTQYVTSELLDPARRRLDLDAIVALDYCWDAIEPEKRSRITGRLVRSLETLDPAANPLDHFTFYRKLCGLAAAIVVYDPEPHGEAGEAAGKAAAAITLAQNYMEGPFPAFCRRRGAMPTSGASGIWEEADIVAALELWGSAGGQDPWPELADSVGRYMEHYFYADTGYGGLNHGFIHDDGSHVPAAPGRVYEGFVPAVPWVIARRTRDPIATWFAQRSLSLTLPAIIPEADRYQWVRLIYGPLDQAEAARLACPLGRNFGGGWVVMRNGWADGDTVLLFDVGQPFWRSRQHFDAGAFQICRKGRLAIDSGDDVTHDAVASKGGKTVIGGEPGDWDQYLQATIAHNCVTVAQRSYEMELYGRSWLAMGNQRLIERNYDLAGPDADLANRQTGTLTAFETNSFYTCAAADLAPAYPAKVVQSFHRRILFINAGAILVLDRLSAAKKHSTKTWHLQLPDRPQVEGGPLEGAHQLHGVDERAGIWELGPDQHWIDVAHLDGRLFVRTLLPADARRRIGGGPMASSPIPAGSMAGKTYFGGGVFGYEHRLWPASDLLAPNAAYELGAPTGLGPQFGAGATWGRLDVQPPEDANEATFLHLLIPADRTREKPPPVRFERRDELAVVDIELPEQDAHLELGLSDDTPGRIILTDSVTRDVLFDKALPATVQPNAQIPGSRTPTR